MHESTGAFATFGNDLKLLGELLIHDVHLVHREML